MPNPLGENLPKEVRRWAGRAVSDAKRRARKTGVPFNLTADDVLRVWSGVCPALGVVLRTGVRATHDSPSLDRVIPELGYVPGNIAILSHRANSIKQDATAAEVYAVSRWLFVHVQKRYDPKEPA